MHGATVLLLCYLLQILEVATLLYTRAMNFVDSELSSPDVAMSMGCSMTYCKSGVRVLLLTLLEPPAWGRLVNFKWRNTRLPAYCVMQH